MLRYLAARGRVDGATAAAELGLTLDQWWKIVESCPWVTFDAPGPLGWSVTEFGDAELKRLAREPEVPT